MGKGSKTRQRAARRAAKAQAKLSAGVGRREPPTPAHGPLESRHGRIVRPTPEREARGKWAERRIGARIAPAVDLHHDTIARLHEAGHISAAQEQAARDWQELRAAYLAEYPDVRGYGSCLDIGVGGHDDSDGDPAILLAYRRIEARLSPRMALELRRVCEDDLPPGSLLILGMALDAVAG